MAFCIEKSASTSNWMPTEKEKLKKTHKYIFTNKGSYCTPVSFPLCLGEDFNDSRIFSRIVSSMEIGCALFHFTLSRGFPASPQPPSTYIAAESWCSHAVARPGISS